MITLIRVMPVDVITPLNGDDEVNPRRRYNAQGDDEVNPRRRAYNAQRDEMNDRRRAFQDSTRGRAE